MPEGWKAGKKQCERCDRWKLPKEYRDGRDAYCSACMEESFSSSGTWREAWDEPASHLTPAELVAASDIRRALEERQDGCCAICGVPSSESRLVVDHDHETGFVRGLLCSNCNSGLGMFRDNEENLEEAKRYLRRPPGLSLHVYYSDVKTRKSVRRWAR